MLRILPSRSNHLSAASSSAVRISLCLLAPLSSIILSTHLVSLSVVLGFGMLPLLPAHKRSPIHLLSHYSPHPSISLLTPPSLCLSHSISHFPLFPLSLPLSVHVCYAAFISLPRAVIYPPRVPACPPLSSSIYLCFPSRPLTHQRRKIDDSFPIP